MILAMYYKPDPDNAYESIQFITNDLTWGWLVRGMHRFGASVFIILMFFHMARVFLFGAYKYPREVNWIVGAALLILGMFEGFTGYLLPWDQTSYWASVVGINITGTGPFVGPFMAQILKAGAEIDGDTLSRFYSIHMLVLPRLIVGLIGLHLYLVIRLGVSNPPWGTQAEDDDQDDEAPARQGLVQPTAEGTASEEGPGVSSADENRRHFEAYKKRRREEREVVLPARDVPRHGDEPRRRVGDHRPDRRLARDGRRHGGGHPRPGVRREGRPGDDELHPAAGLVLLLPLLPPADLQVAEHRSCSPRSGIPTILMMLLFALPFIDRSAERRLSRRPVAIVAAILTAVAMGVLTWKGATAAEFLASEAPTLAKEFQEAEQPAARRRSPAPSSSQPPAV